MVEFAYTTVTGKIKPILDKIRTVGVPPKVTVAWLKTLGFRSSNDLTLIGVLKFISFIDSNGVPTSTWASYRGRNHKRVLGDAIREGYSDLYAVYADAHTRSNTELGHVFSTSSSAGAQVIGRTVATFKALVDEAEFLPTQSTAMQAGQLHTPPADEGPPVAQVSQSSNGPALHIDIQIHISAESTSEQIEKIFESMAKHLYGRKGD